MLQERNIAGSIFVKSKPTAIIQNFTMDVVPRYKFNENFYGGVIFQNLEISERVFHSD